MMILDRRSLFHILIIALVCLMTASSVTSPALARKQANENGQVELALVRVTADGESEITVPPGSNSSCFNLDSTRFLIDVDGSTTLYAFDPNTLAYSREKSLVGSAHLDGCQWSAYSPDRLFGFTAGDGFQCLTHIYDYDLNTKSYSHQRLLRRTRRRRRR